MPNRLPLSRFILPVGVVLGVLMMGLRVVTIWGDAEMGRFSFHAAQAKEATAEPAAEAAKPSPSKQADPPPAEAAATPPPPLLPPPPPDSSAAEQDILKQVAGRREELDKRAHDLDTREAMMKITEQRIDKKAAELETLRQQLQTLVGQGNEAQQAQFDNLVKIYETMKPEEAARIFEALDMPTLVGVIQRMKPAHTGPIMAKMAPPKAKAVTDALTHQDQLPTIK